MSRALGAELGRGGRLPRSARRKQLLAAPPATQQQQAQLLDYLLKP